MSPKKLLATLIFLIQGCFFGSVQAVPIDSNVYQATVPIASQRANERPQAFAAALQQVLIKRSGNPNVAEVDLIKQQLNDAERWVMQYQYQRAPEQTLLLQVRFSPEMLDSLLEQAGQPVAQIQRPLTLVWLAVGNNEHYQLIGSLASNQIPVQMQDIAQEWGFPILFPTLDLLDMQQVSATAVWQAEVEPILRASQRYAVENILISKLFQHAEDKWEGYWLMHWQGQWFSWHTSGASIREVISQVMQQISLVMVAQKPTESVAPSASKTVTVYIEQVDNLTDYHKVMNYLNQLPMVRTTQVKQLYPNALELYVRLNGDVLMLQQALNTGTLLSLVTLRADGTLVYRLNR